MIHCKNKTKVKTYGISDVGNVRKLQEDSILLDEEINLFLVADGMGGHNAGDLASKIVTHKIGRMLKKDPLTETNIRTKIIHSIRKINKDIYKYALHYENHKGMGTTLTLLLIHNNRYYIANIGDSRTYLLRKNRFKMITEDHSYVYEQFLKGLISKNEMRTSKNRNLITRAVGISPEVKVDLFTGDVMKGDLFLLCSDGLYSEMNDQTIKKILLKTDSLNRKCKDLVNHVKNKKGLDNISVITVNVMDVSEPEEDNSLKTMERTVIRNGLLI